MAKTKPFFLTGANAKIKLNNRTVAFATDISYSIRVNHASPRVLGRFEVEVHQPLSYDVEGQLTIIRYGRGLKDFFGPNAPISVANKGDGVGSFGVPGINYSTLGLPNSNGQFDGAADEAFNPSRFFQSKMFDIEIRQKVPGAEAGAPLVGPVVDGLISGALTGNTGSSNNETQVVVLRDCRFTQLDFSLSKKQAAMITLSFRARYADDDTTIARKSGVGQELT